MIALAGYYSLVAVCAIMCASIFEWTLHRFVMHRPVGKFRAPFEKHALTHHRMFRGDATYHCVREEDKRKIRMAWWNGPVLVTVLLLPCAALTIPLGLWSVLMIFGVVSGAYFFAYEYTHWCMHLPREQQRMVERWRVFKFLNGHHILHHRYMGKNFNVVLPLADWFLGTLLLRAPKRFLQPRGPSIPDVQPLRRR